MRIRRAGLARGALHRVQGMQLRLAHFLSVASPVQLNDVGMHSHIPQHVGMW